MLGASAIKETAAGEGFDICGITPVKQFDDQRAFYDGWLGRGYSGGLGYLHRNIDKRFDPELLMPGAKSIVVCGVSYKNDTSMGYGECRSPKIASYARAADYHRIIKAMLRSLATTLEERYGAFAWRAFTDSAPLLEKRAAAEAGLGWVGRNTLLVTPRNGSFVLLGELIIDRRVDVYDTPLAVAGCGGCTRCVDACPNRALTTEGLDARRCIACITIEERSPVKTGAILLADSTHLFAIQASTFANHPHFSADSAHPSADLSNSSAISTHGWIFGCDECQSICPYNALAPMYSNLHFRPVFDPREMTAEDWLEITPEQFRHRLADTPLARAGLDNLKMTLVENLKIISSP